MIFFFLDRNQQRKLPQRMIIDNQDGKKAEENEFGKPNDNKNKLYHHYPSLNSWMIGLNKPITYFWCEGGKN